MTALLFVLAVALAAVAAGRPDLACLFCSALLVGLVTESLLFDDDTEDA